MKFISRMCQSTFQSVCSIHFFSLLSICLLLNCVTKTQQQQQGNITHTTTTLSEARYTLVSTSSGELVFFGGGYNSTGPSDRVDIYNVTSGNWTTAILSIPRYELAATSSQNLVFFGGGWVGTTVYDRVDIYNTLNGSWSTANLSQPRAYLAATSVRNLTLFGGGSTSPNSPTNVVDMFDVTSNTWTTATLSQARWNLAATSVDNRYALFGGGNNGSFPSNVVDIFDSLNGIWNTTTLSQPRFGLTATSLGNLAFFGGGQTDQNQLSNVVDIFNSTSQTWSNTTLSQARDQLASSSIGEIVAFGGGSNVSTASSVVDMLNVTSNIWFTVTLSQPRRGLASTSSTNKIFFGGGQNSNGTSDIVDIFCFDDICPLPPPLPPTTPPSTPIPIPTTTQPQPSAPPTIPSSPSPQSPPPSPPPIPIPPTESPSTPIPVPSLDNSPSTNSTENISTPSSNSFPSGAIAGIVIGIVLIGVSVVVLIFLLRRFRRSKETNATSLSPLQSEENVNTSERKASFLTMPRSNTIQPLRVSTEEFSIEREIAGSYGKVCFGKWNGVPVVWKYGRQKGNIDHLMNEIKMIVELPQHSNVVQVFGISFDGPQAVVIMEYCDGGSLGHLLFNCPDQMISNERKIEIVRGISRGMLHLHKYDIIHGDLCARNILLTSSGELKISDYGISRILEKVGKEKSEASSICWKAPETLSNMVYNKQTDVWTFGIVVYEIVSRNEPFKNMDVIEVGIAIRDRGLTPTIPNDCPSKLREVMELCWKKDPTQRPSFEMICEILSKS